MPVIANNSLDDSLLLDGNNSFVGGQVSAPRANLVPQDAYAEGKNIDLDEFGNAVTRRGASLSAGYLVWNEVNVNWESENAVWEGLVAPITSLGYFDTGSTEYIVVADGSNYLKALTETGGFTLLTGATYASGATIRFAQLNNRFYYTDESNDLRYIEGSTDPVAAQTITAGKITGINITEGGSGYTSPPTVTIDAPSSGVTATGTAGTIKTILQLFLSLRQVELMQLGQLEYLKPLVSLSLLLLTLTGFSALAQTLLCPLICFMLAESWMVMRGI